MQEGRNSTAWEASPYALQPWIVDAVLSLGFTQMTPVQASTIPLLSQNKDVVVEAVTGSGKTLAFVIPVIEKICRCLQKESFKKGHFGAILLSPTRELASQINQVFQNILQFQPDDKTKVKTQLLVGSMGSIREDLQEFHINKPQIIVATPGRALEFLSNETVKTSSCEILILDEADKLLDISFSHDTETIVRQLPRQRRTGLFSATMSSAGSNVFRTGMTNPVKITVKSSSLESKHTPTSLGIYFMVLSPEMKLKHTLNLILRYKFKKAIVYFPTCVCVSHFYSLFRFLLKENSFSDEEKVSLFSLHGKLDAKPRLKTLENFSSSLTKSVLFTTDVAARGLDVPEVDLVLQIDAPTDPELFLHRCGRTGRANKVGKAYTLLNPGREENFVDFMEVKNVPLKESKVHDLDPEFVAWFDKTLRSWLLEDRARYDQAVKSYVSFIRYYSKHQAGSIFRLQSLDYVGLAKMYGLSRIPKMPENRYIENFPEDGWIDKTIDFDVYCYKNTQKEESRLIELKSNKLKGERAEKSKLKRQLAHNNAPWSAKTDSKLTKEDRRKKSLKRKVEVENFDSGSEEETDWKELVRANKLKKKNAVTTMFDGI